MTQVRVHRKDNSARFKEMEVWMEKNLTGEGVGVKASEVIETSPAKHRTVIKASQASEQRRSPRRTGNTDKEVHSIPCRKGIKVMSEREANECAQHGEVLRWSTDSGEDEYPQLQQEEVESEEPTEFGVVCERFVIRETQHMDGALSRTGGVITTATNDTIGICDSNEDSVLQAPQIGMEQTSPCLSEYESEGYLERRKANSRQSLGRRVKENNCYEIDTSTSSLQ